jgi:ubiquinone/menaquinone biosynthesis C-methylase UbiE
MNMNVLEWPIPKELLNSEDYAGNQFLARNISVKGYKRIISEYINITPAQFERLLSLVPEAWDGFYGVGIDLGGGVGCIASTIALKQDVETLYCVELVSDIVTLCQPVVKRGILKEQEYKVISVVGDYNHLQLESNSIDFSVAWGSLHHAIDPVTTLRECRRVLKPEGKLVVIERAHNNATPDSEIERLLNIVYSVEFLERTYRDPNMRLTRRQNGEHEYRYREWEKFFCDAGFQINQRVVWRTKQTEKPNKCNDAGLMEIESGFDFRKEGGVRDSLACYVLQPQA